MSLRVIIESPYAGDIERNVAYARAAMRDCFSRNETPFASHLLYTQVYDDATPAEREMGMRGGWTWMHVADLVAVYYDLGISSGMRRGIEEASRFEISIEFRSILDWDKEPTP